MPREHCGLGVLECPANTPGIDQGVARARPIQRLLSVNLRPAEWWQGPGPAADGQNINTEYNNMQKNHIIADG